ncbi:MAG: Spy/CpxP family protein refolding chaperone [Colwellia sp.]
MKTLILKKFKPLLTASALCTLSAVMLFPGMTSAKYMNSINPQLMTVQAAGDFQGGGGFEGDRHMNKMVKVLALTEQQQSDIKTIKDQARDEHAVLRQSMMSYQDEKKALVTSSSFDESAFVALQAAYQPIFAQMALERAKTKNAIFNVLTTEQQALWQEFMANRKGNRKSGKRGR